MGLFPTGPYGAYPVIEEVADRGAGYPAVLTMLMGYGLLGTGRIPFGLVFFGTEIVGLRLALAIFGTILVGFLTVGVVAALR